MIPDGDGKGNSQQPHGDICHRQWHHEEVGDALQVGVEADGPAHQDVPSHSQAGDHQLQANVDQLFILLHGCFFPPSCFLCAFIPHAQLLNVFSDAGTRLPNRIGASQGKSDCVTGGRPRQEVPTTNMALVMPDFTFTFNRHTHTHTRARHSSSLSPFTFGLVNFCHRWQRNIEEEASGSFARRLPN